jgi:hypothetical protein
VVVGLYVIDSDGKTASVGHGITVSPAPPVVRHCGSIDQDETWGGSSIHLVTCGVTIPSGITLTIAKGSIVKAQGLSAFSVDGSLVVQGGPGVPAVLTAAGDDSVGGDTDGDGPTGSWNVEVRRGGRVSVDHGDIRFGHLRAGYLASGNDPRVTVSTTDSSVSDSTLDVTHGDLRIEASSFTRSSVVLDSGAATVRSNTFVGSPVSLFNLYGETSPVVVGNAFTDSPSGPSPSSSGFPLRVHGAEDVSGVVSNTASGTPEQRVFAFEASHVHADWALDPATSAVYRLTGMTIDGGATMTAPPGAVIKANDLDNGATNALTVLDHGTLRANGATLTSASDDVEGGDTNGDGATPVSRWSGIRAELGSTIRVSDSTISHAIVALDANPGFAWNLITPWADVSATDSVFLGNIYDIRNGPKDWGTSLLGGDINGKAVDASGSTVSPLLVSFHIHSCVPPPTDPPLPVLPAVKWDVTFGLPDGECLPGYTDSPNHPVSADAQAPYP